MKALKVRETMKLLVLITPSLASSKQALSDKNKVVFYKTKVETNKKPKACN